MNTEHMEQLKQVRRIVTHGGSAHEDDLIAVCLALHLIAAGHMKDKPSVVVERRDPSEAEIDDPEVLVLDVGKAYKPECLTFDHHQYDDERVAGQCALSLFAQWLGLDEVFGKQRWWAALVQGDAMGPYAVAANLGLPSFPFELESPVNRAMLRMFERCETHEVYDTVSIMLGMLGETILSMAQEFARRYDELSERGEAVTRNGVTGVLVHEVLSDFDKYEVGQWLVDSGVWARLQDGKPFAFVMYHSQRGAGWDFHRYNDAPSVNFAGLAGRPGIDFAHGVGFFVQTTERLSVADTLELVSDGLQAEAPRGWDKV